MDCLECTGALSRAGGLLGLPLGDSPSIGLTLPNARVVPLKTFEADAERGREAGRLWEGPLNDIGKKEEGEGVGAECRFC